MTALKVKTNLRCAACVRSIAPLFDSEPGIDRWEADISTPEKWLAVEGDGVTAAQVDGLLRAKGYQVVGAMPAENPTPVSSYFPLILILFYLLGAAALVEVAFAGFDGMRAMRHFMAGFFLVFSFFKLLDIRSFAMSYSGYDVVARRWPGFGFVYPFLELGLGAAYLANFWPKAASVATLAVMGVSIVGVVQALIARRKIQCACLGTVFNLPMSSVTLIEDLSMIAMAALMLIAM